MSKQIELRPGQNILFIGDSITDADRKTPVHKPFGFGYVNFVARLLLGKYHTYNLNILNTGISGNTITDLKNRWQTDCLDHSPDILSILIGINDVWYQFDTKDRLPYAVLLDEYKTTYTRLLTLAKTKCNSQLVICEPFMFCDDYNNPMFVHLSRYIEAVHRIADDFNACLVPLQKAINERIKEVPPQNWSSDSVHPEVWAHAWISQQWLITTGL